MERSAETLADQESSPQGIPIFGLDALSLLIPLRSMGVRSIDDQQRDNRQADRNATTVIPNGDCAVSNVECRGKQKSFGETTLAAERPDRHSEHSEEPLYFALFR